MSSKPRLNEYQRVGLGALAGVGATVVMSAVFFAGQRLGTIGTLPPRLIVARLLPDLSRRGSQALSAVAHLGYGAVAGAGFGIARGRSLRSGLLYGLAVWAVSYELWVPAADVLPPAHRDQRSRAATIAAAHVIFGLALGALSAVSARRFERDAG
jgi:hypothetical protein